MNVDQAKILEQAQDLSEDSWEVFSTSSGDFSDSSEESADEECGDEVFRHGRRKRAALS